MSSRKPLTIAFIRTHHEELYSLEVRSPYERLTLLLADTFGTSHRKVYDTSAGMRQPDGNWTGVIGLLNRSEADIASSVYILSEERGEAVSFSYPIFFSESTFVTKKPEYIPNAFAMFLPISPAVWLILAISMFLITLACYFLLKRKGSFSKVAIDVLASTLAQPSPIKPNSIGEHQLILSWMVGITFIGICYKSLFLSFLTRLPLTGVRDIPELAAPVAKGEYQCMALRDSFLPYLLQSSVREPERILRYNISKNPYGYGPVKHFLELNSSKIANVAWRRDLQFLSGRYFVSEDSCYSFMGGLIMRKDFCCKKQVDTFIHRIAQSGIFYKLLSDKDFKTAVQSIPSDSESKRTKLSMIEVESAFLIWIVGISTASIVFLVEIIVNKLKA